MNELCKAIQAGFIIRLHFWLQKVNNHRNVGNQVNSVYSESVCFEQALRAAFATAVPTEAEAERRLRDGRGFGDLDGPRSRGEGRQ